ncbi:hypothetical protein ACWFNE_08450 [Cellulomonas sp. NPDC055163]
MDMGRVSDDDIRAARDAWLLVRPPGEREGPEYAFLLNLVQAQSRQLAAEFRAARSGPAERAGRADPSDRAGGQARSGRPDGAPPG